MAHNLEIKDGKASFFSVKEKPWHNLGTIVDGALTSAEAIKEASLDFEVLKVPMLEQFPDGKGGFFTKESSERFTTVRTGEKQATLGYVGAGYHVLQNTTAFDFFDSIVDKGEAIFETAGVLGNGERIFITAKLPEYISVKGNGKEDLIEQYIFLTNGHDGKNSVMAAFTPVRIVCNNTLNLALKTCNNKITLRHTVNMQEKLKAAHQLMGIQNLYKNELTEIFNAMSKTKATDKQYEKVIVHALAKNKPKTISDYFKGEAGTARFKNTVDTALEYAFSHPTQQDKNTRGTVYGIYNSVSGFFQNANDWKGNEDNKLANLIDGDTALKSEIAFDMCKELILA